MTLPHSRQRDRTCWPRPAVRSLNEFSCLTLLLPLLNLTLTASLLQVEGLVG